MAKVRPKSPFAVVAKLALNQFSLFFFTDWVWAKCQTPNSLPLTDRLTGLSPFPFTPPLSLAYSTLPDVRIFLYISPNRL